MIGPFRGPERATEIPNCPGFVSPLQGSEIFIRTPRWSQGFCPGLSSQAPSGPKISLPDRLGAEARPADGLCPPFLCFPYNPHVRTDRRPIDRPGARGSARWSRTLVARTGPGWVAGLARGIAGLGQGKRPWHAAGAWIESASPRGELGNQRLAPAPGRHLPWPGRPFLLRLGCSCRCSGSDPIRDQTTAPGVGMVCVHLYPWKEAR
jgi:hypothetical protein